jgi:hypothetical protein
LKQYGGGAKIPFFWLGVIIMSDGGITKGYTFWATINIKGLGQDEVLDQKKLKELMLDIRKKLDPVNGEVVHSVTISKDKFEEPKLSISMRESPTTKEIRRKKRQEDDRDDG